MSRSRARQLLLLTFVFGAAGEKERHPDAPALGARIAFLLEASGSAVLAPHALGDGLECGRRKGYWRSQQLSASTIWPPAIDAGELWAYRMYGYLLFSAADVILSIASLTVKLAALARGGNALKLSRYFATMTCAGTNANPRRATQSP